MRLEESGSGQYRGQVGAHLGEQRGRRTDVGKVRGGGLRRFERPLLRYPRAIIYLSIYQSIGRGEGGYTIFSKISAKTCQPSSVRRHASCGATECGGAEERCRAAERAARDLAAVGLGEDELRRQGGRRGVQLPRAAQRQEDEGALCAVCCVLCAVCCVHLPTHWHQPLPCSVSCLSCIEHARIWRRSPPRRCRALHLLQGAAPEATCGCRQGSVFCRGSCLDSCSLVTALSGLS